MEISRVGLPEAAPSPTIHSLAIHRGPVRGLVVLSGHQALSAASDGSLARWSLPSRDAPAEVVEQVPAHEGAIRALAHHGEWLASAGTDLTLRVWRVGDTLEPHLVLGEAELGFAPLLHELALTGRWLIAIGASSRGWVIDVETGEIAHLLSGHAEPIRALAVSPDGTHAATVAVDHELRRWALGTGECVQTLRPSAGAVRDVAGLRLAPADAPNLLRFLSDTHLLEAGLVAAVWDLDAGEVTLRDASFPWPIRAAAVAPPRGEGEVGRLYLGTQTEIRGLRWPPAPDAPADDLRFPAPLSGVASLAAAGDRLVVGGQDGAVQVLDVRAAPSAQPHLSQVREAHVVAGGGAVTVDHDGRVALWGTHDGRPRGLVEGGLGTTRAVPPLAFSDDGTMFATTPPAGRPAVVLHHTEDGALAGTLDHRDARGASYPVGALAFAWDGILVAPSDHRPMQWWSLDGERGQELQQPSHRVAQMALVGHRLVAQTVAGEQPAELQQWDLWEHTLQWTHTATGKLLGRLAFGRFTVLSDGLLLAGTGERHTEIGLWNVADGELTWRWDLGRPWRVAAEGPDDRLLIVAWDASRWRHELITVQRTAEAPDVRRRELPPRATHVALAPAAGRLAWAEGSTVVVSELEDPGEPVRQFVADEPAITTLAWSADGARLVAGGRSGRVHVFAVQ